MRKLTIILLVMLAAASCGSSKKAAKGAATGSQEITARIGTFNLWVSHIGKGDYVWANRKEKLAQAIVDNDMDIFAGEEVDTVIFREIPPMVAAKGGNYTWKTFSPYNPDGETAVKAQAIIYKPDVFEMLEFHHFWCSETPDEMSTGWDEMRFKRGACCATMLHKATGRKIFVMISHFPLGAEARLHFAPIILERAKLYNPENLPAFFLGDLNTREERPESAILREYWTDAYLSVPFENHVGPKGTFNLYGRNEDMDAAPRIDFVYYRGEGIQPNKYVVNTQRYDGLYPSDHCPVYVDFTIR